MNRRHRTTRGFTLIELLVVVAIIVALLAILLPSMNKAFEVANRAVCGSNQHQTHNAHLAWVSDHMGEFVAGQPVYDPAGSNSGGTGHYAVWFRGWNGSKNQEYGGSYTKHGALVRRGYLPDGKTFYCPSWTGTIGWQKSGSAHTGTPGGGWFEDEADVPASQSWMQTTYHYNSTFGYEQSPSLSGWRAPRITDSGSAALMADAFSDPIRGVDQHHGDGYNVLNLGGAVAYYSDPDHEIRDLNGGSTYHAGTANFQIFQAPAWRMLIGR